MKITTHTLDDNELLVQIAGEFDALGCQTTQQIWQNLLEQPECQHIILDLTNTTFLDSSGVGAIVFLFKRLRANGGQMSLTGACGQPQELLDLLHIYQAIPATEKPVYVS